MRRGTVVMIAALAMVAASATPVLARPPHNGSGQPDNDTYIPPRTPAQAAFERTKLSIVAAVERQSRGGLILKFGNTGVFSPSVCETACDYYGGTGPGGSGGTGGSTGTTGIPTQAILEVYARRQSTSFWCGPAAGQVVINYTRGYASSGLNGDSASTNWRSQATIAGWMKTTESTGTLGSNLAAALNRLDAVRKPIAEWSYLYGSNEDGADMHAKIVTDVGKFAMPLVIAVKPHKTDADYFLPSWPRELPGGKHWITIYGYDGFWDGTDGPKLYYTESSGNGSQGPGSYAVGSLTMWKVNQYNASTMVW